jgi:hypothetical protein
MPVERQDSVNGAAHPVQREAEEGIQSMFSDVLQ